MRKKRRTQYLFFVIHLRDWVGSMGSFNLKRHGVFIKWGHAWVEMFSSLLNAPVIALILNWFLAGHEWTDIAIPDLLILSSSCNTFEHLFNCSVISFHFAPAASCLLDGVLCNHDNWSQLLQFFLVSTMTLLTVKTIACANMRVPALLGVFTIYWG